MPDRPLPGRIGGKGQHRDDVAWLLIGHRRRQFQAVYQPERDNRADCENACDDRMQRKAVGATKTADWSATALPGAGARESSHNTGTEDSLRSDAVSETGAMSGTLTGLATLGAGDCSRLATCAGSKSPRLIASIRARVAASGATSSSLRRRSVRSFARLSAASRPLCRANSFSAIRCRSSRVGSSAIKRSAAAMAPSPSPFASAFRHSTAKTSAAAAASRSASWRCQVSNSSIVQNDIG